MNFPKLTEAELAGVVGGMHRFCHQKDLGGGNAVSVNPLTTKVHLSGTAANAVASALNGAAAAFCRVPVATAALSGAGALLAGMNSAGKGITITTVTALPLHGPIVVMPRK